MDKTAENGNSTLQAIVGAYLESRKREKDAGGLSASSYSSDVYRLDEFKRHCERETENQTGRYCDGGVFGGLSVETLGRDCQGQDFPVSVKHVLRTVKACLKWAYKQETIDVLPRVLEDYAKVTLPTPPLASSTPSMKSKPCTRLPVPAFACTSCLA